MLAKKYTKSLILNHIKNIPNYLQSSDDLSEPLEHNFIENSEICSHCWGEYSLNIFGEIVILRNKFSNSNNSLDYILYIFDTPPIKESNIKCYEFTYKKLKQLLYTLNFYNWVRYEYDDDNSITETIWEIIWEQDYDGVLLNEMYVLSLDKGFFQMESWMYNFLSQLDEKSNCFIHDEGETNCNLPFLSNLIVTFGWEQTKKILDMYEKVDDNPLVNKVWVKNHPINFIIAEGINNIDTIYKKYFCSCSKSNIHNKDD